MQRKTQNERHKNILVVLIKYLLKNILWVNANIHNQFHKRLENDYLETKLNKFGIKKAF